MNQIPIPGATYVYQEYPACRYHPDGRVRTITCKEQEEPGWYDSPTLAQADARKLADELSAKAAANKEAARKAKQEQENGPPGVGPSMKFDKPQTPFSGLPTTKQAVTRMNLADLTALAARMNLTVPDGTKRPDLIKLINASLDQPAPAQE